MSTGRTIGLVLLVIGFIVAKIWVFLKGAGWTAAILGAILLIFSEPASAGG